MQEYDDRFNDDDGIQLRVARPLSDEYHSREEGVTNFGYTGRDSGYGKTEPQEVYFVHENWENGFPKAEVTNGRLRTSESKAFGDDDVPPADYEKVNPLIAVQDQIYGFASNHSTALKRTIYSLIAAGYSAYFAYAMYYSGLETEDDIRLLWVTMVVLFCFLVVLVDKTCGNTLLKLIDPIGNFISDHLMIIGIVLGLLALVGYIVFLVVEVGLKDTRNLQSLSGIVIYILIFFIFSTNPAKVRWRPVIWGYALQFILALIILRTQWGYDAFFWLGQRAQEFLEHANAGAIFAFGDDYRDHMFAFAVMPVIVYFSTVISVLYYLGAMQAVILKIAWLMQRTLGTTAAESVNAAGNIFIGQTEAPLLIGPFLKEMTKSEVHAVMTGGFATIAGSVLASYILFGVPANHLITASVMAAPMALALSKLSCPETEESRTTGEDVKTMSTTEERNVIEAASAGASASIKLVANILANIIAFIALLQFVNATLTWMGARVGVESLTFQFICSYVLWPFAFIMGVDNTDCRKVAEFIGFKVFINEFVAYTELGAVIENKNTFDEYIQQYPGENTWNYVGDDIYLKNTNTTLFGGIISDRSSVISTYALCGFANVGSMGMVIGALGSMAPNQKPIIAGLAVRAMLTGTCVSFLNACTAGLLYQDN